MSITSRPAALVFRLVAIGLIVTGLLRLAGVFDGGAHWGVFLFYTTQSNVLVLIWMVLMAGTTVRDWRRDGPRGLAAPWPRWGATVMMAITVTMLVYLVVLAPSAFVQGSSEYVPFTLTDDLVHIITPCLAIADWFLFSPKGRLRWFEPFVWVSPPAAYLLFAFTYSALGGRFGDGWKYPYPFMDVGEFGVGGVALQILVMAVALEAFGYIYVLADHLLAKCARRRATGAATASNG
ncbi:MAG: Pr6Pr family membrane protein [Bifidobacteriaceae bacterium]|jgi:hypothetical protein|nr:Pr6Pr family membrane protein [Bifidobacteriaceae bacterium]